jgi:outer membrane receptor for monomeric catechols
MDAVKQNEKKNGEEGNGKSHKESYWVTDIMKFYNLNCKY